LIICYACITCPIARCRSQFHWQKLFDVQKNHYLTVRQQRFVAEFMLTGNGAEAARQATIEDARRQANPGAVIRGWVEIAKMVGLYEPQQAEVALGAGSERLRAKFEAMSDDELMAITRL
jgi:Na+-translocating ferredoxin:NAD+ oxidoreductase RnfC subunit